MPAGDQGAARQAASPSTAPTERSMPAVSTTSVSPADMMNSGTAWRSTLTRLFQVRKCGERIESADNSAQRPEARQDNEQIDPARARSQLAGNLGGCERS